MKLNFMEMAKRDEPLRLEQDINMGSLLVKRRDVLKHSPIHAELKANLIGDILHVNGHLSGEIVFACSRCLQEVKQSIRVPFQEAFSQDKQFDDESNEDDVFYIADKEFEIDPYPEATFLLDIPFVALCKEDCQGLCPQCGVNRNEESCACKTERIDPRLADLQKFFDK